MAYLFWINLTQPQMFPRVPILSAYYNGILLSSARYVNISCEFVDNNFYSKLIDITDTSNISLARYQYGSQTAVGHRWNYDFFEIDTLEIDTDNLDYSINVIANSDVINGLGLDYNEENNELRIQNPYGYPIELYKNDKLIDTFYTQTSLVPIAGTIQYITYPAERGSTYQIKTQLTFSNTYYFTSNKIQIPDISDIVYTVTFNSNGGSEVPSQQVTKGNTVSRPPNPTREGYAFLGWYLDDNLVQIYNFNTPVTSNITLYAKWTQNFYTVIFNSNGGSIVESQSVVWGNKAKMPDDPTKYGYNFSGWYTDKSLTVGYDFNKVVTANITLYAKWIEKVSESVVIIIPSKRIYSKNFDPIIDNNIDKVEVALNEPQLITNTENVYSETINSFPSDESQIAYETLAVHQTIIGATDYTIYSARYTKIIPQYVNREIFVPISSQNKQIISVLTGVNDSGNTNIQISISGSIKRGEITGYAAIGTQPVFSPVAGSAGRYAGTFTISNTTIINKTIKQSTDGYYELFHTNKTYINQNSSAPTFIPVTLEFITKDNVLKADTEPIKIDNKDYLKLNLTVLVGISVIFMSFSKRYDQEGYPDSPSTIPTDATRPTDSSFEDYTPDVVSISLNGEIIKLDLQDKTITIDNGNKVFSFDSNELIQDTNTPTIESKYQTIIDKWKNGKQTAVITCPIADYYDENGNKVIDIIQSGKMLFQEGNIVIPYTYTNQGDKPLSYNKDFTPKQFKIVGTKISKRQGGTQELTLQEV